MVFTVGIAQTCHPADGDVVGLVARFARKAKEQGAGLLVFPESLMSRYEAALGDFLAESQPTNGPFAQAVNAIAAREGLWLVYTINELNAGGLPFNTAIVADPSGAVRGIYRKVHLFDSSTTAESQRMAAGDGLLSPVKTPFGKVGVAICYDLRFPEVARAAALSGCDVMAFPSAWVDGPGKAEQWETLLRARAIENELFVIGACRADAGYIGRSLVAAPDGSVLARAGEGEQLVTAQLDTARIAAMRSAIPVLDHRRPSAYRHEP